jgi:hypothetical protein
MHWAVHSTRRGISQAGRESGLGWRSAEHDMLAWCLIKQLQDGMHSRRWLLLGMVLVLGILRRRGMQPLLVATLALASSQSLAGLQHA